jgi:hypothetical protein
MSTSRVAHDPFVAVWRRHLPSFAGEDQIFLLLGAFARALAGAFFFDLL